MMVAMLPSPSRRLGYVCDVEAGASKKMTMIGLVNWWTAGRSDGVAEGGCPDGCLLQHRIKKPVLGHGASSASLQH